MIEKYFGAVVVLLLVAVIALCCGYWLVGVLLCAIVLFEYMRMLYGK
ncbi:MAG: hypothetical protein J6C85_01585 [Alphaproteobacteria bacterium]|nr:hypothetical protein [Alphaproteobacteria bacterium]